MKYYKAPTNAKASCVIIPTLKNGKESKLFKDLMSHLHDRALAKKVWYFTQVDDVISAYPDLEKDENGEFTYAAVNKLLGLDNMLSARNAERSKAFDLGLLTRDGSPASHANHQNALNAVEHFNNDAKEQVATAKLTTDGTVQTEVKDRTVSAMSQAEQNSYDNALNKLLLARLHEIGFDVSFVDDPIYAGVFDPMLAQQNAGNLKTVIQLAKGERGAEAFPEEFAHVILAGLKNDNIKQRIDRAFTDDVVKQVLGAEYDNFVKRYSGDEMPIQERLRREAEGKMLADVIKKGESVSPIGSLFRRLWNKAKKLLGMINPNDIDNAVALARESVKPIAGLVKEGGLDSIISREQVMRHPKMYNLTDKLAKLEEMAMDGEALLSKRLSLIRRESRPTVSTKMESQRIKAIRRQLAEKKYASACYSIMHTIAQHVERIARTNEQFEGISDSAQDMHTIAEESYAVRRMGIALKAYLPYVTMLQSIDKLRQSGQIEMDEETAQDIIRLANETRATLDDIQNEYRTMRFAVLKQLVMLYYGDSPMLNGQTDEAKAASVEMLLQRADKDIRLGDTSLFSAGNSTSPLINIIHNIISRKQGERDQQLNDIAAEMQEANAKLYRAGYSNDFVYQRDSEGIPTGYYAGPIDMARYESERQAFIDSLDDKKYDLYRKKVEISKWEEEHTEEVIVDPETGRTEILPRADKFPSNYDKNWSDAQKEYYKTLMTLKAKMDSLLPVTAQCLYTAPQKRKDISQAFDAGTKGLKKMLWGKFKQEMCTVEDNPDYEQNAYIEENGEKVVATDFDGKPIKKVPVYFTNKLADLSNLSTDSASAMISYAAMAINYNQMNEISDAMILMQDHLSSDFEVTQTEAGKVIRDAFTALGKTFTRDYVETGGNSNIARQGIKYIDQMIFNKRKNKVGSIQIFNKTIDLDALFNTLMRYNSILRMGVNPISGTVNLMQGEYQILSEATTGRYFNVKETAWADKEYKKLLLDHIRSFNDIDRHDKMYLLTRAFNSSEDFFRDAQDVSYNQNAYKRVLGKGNVYFLNTMGEHKIHTQSMLAMLKHTKVTRNSDNKEVSLYDCFEPVHDDKGWHIALTSDITFDTNTDEKTSLFQAPYVFNMEADENGKIVVKKGKEEQLVQNINILVNHVNAGMFGGYSDRERGTMNSTMVGRLVMQFRQWMPGTYDKLFSRKYYDAITGTEKEGTFMTLGRFILNCAQDLKNHNLKMAVNWNQLTPDEQANIRLCGAQTFLVIGLYCLASGLLGWKNEDDAAKRFAAFTIKRLSTEVNAVYPLTAPKDLWTIVKSPIPATSTMDNFMDVAWVPNWFKIVKSGRYKGWPVALKNLYTLTPVVYNVGKVVDLAKYNYIFNIFN